MANTNTNVKKEDPKPVGTMTPEQIQALVAQAVAEATAGVKEQAKAELLAEMQADKDRVAKLNQEKEAKTEALFAAEEKSTLGKLKAQEQVDILIPFSELGDNSPVPVGINGVIYTIPKGKKFKVPKDIYTQWQESYNKTLAANMKLQRGRADEEMKIEG